MIFTIQERSVMKLMMKRKGDSIIAREMEIKIGTLRSHKVRIFHKLQNAEVSPEQNIAYWKMCE